MDFFFFGKDIYIYLYIYFVYPFFFLSFFNRGGEGSGQVGGPVMHTAARQGRGLLGVAGP